jgi:hypothetical protein
MLPSRLDGNLPVLEGVRGEEVMQLQNLGGCNGEPQER